jgi:hypothetical protein
VALYSSLPVCLFKLILACGIGDAKYLIVLGVVAPPWSMPKHVFQSEDNLPAILGRKKKLN